MAMSQAGFFPFEEAKEISELDGIVESIVCIIYDQLSVSVMTPTYTKICNFLSNNSFRSANQNTVIDIHQYLKTFYCSKTMANKTGNVRIT